MNNFVRYEIRCYDTTCATMKSNRMDLKNEVTIGEIRKNIKPPKNPQFTPHKYLSMGELSQNTLRHLKWMLQKDLLKQDMFLIGRPGPTRRQLAMIFLEMTGREVEYVSLSRDTTESDIKQRREICGGTAKYFDQNAVRAAVEGRVLILEGIEKAERNVLPVLNNLLENREMNLEDGRFLIPASRYDKLIKEHSKEEVDKWNLVRVSDDFRVIALGLPVPKYSGNPLDPPLRSRFQARNISPNSYQEQLQLLKEIAPNGDIEKISQILSCAYALVTEESTKLGLPDFPVDSLPKLGYILHKFPASQTSELLNRLYPFESFLKKEEHESINHILNTFQVKKYSPSKSKVEEVKCSSESNTATCTVSYNSASTTVEVPCGSLTPSDISSKYIPTNFQDNLIVQLLQSHSVSDFCVIGPRGCGKSVALLKLASLLNYEVEPIVLYQDMTSRDLIQQRNTLPNGDTVWNNSPLIQAALDGKLAVLDGIDRVHPSTLSVIHSLVHDRDVQLYDGQRLVRHDRYEEIKQQHNFTDEDMTKSKILKVHPSFRIVALAESLKKDVKTTKWLSPEMLSLFLYHEMRPLSYEEECQIITKLYGSTNEKIEAVLSLAKLLRTSEDPALLALSPYFSTRQLLRISKRLKRYPQDSVSATVGKACLARFLPSMTKEALEKAMKKVGIDVESSDPQNEAIACEIVGNKVKVGSTEIERFNTQSKSKVPDILFYDVPQHLVLLEWLIQDFSLGEHLLLVGNQGVGKNKVADRLLQLLNRPREYIQLHRDTTVQTLTLQPTVKDGIVYYEDSPLVQAVKNGHVLVVDEADKAPTHVTCILKTLVESGEMTLSDGRKIVPHGDARVKRPNVIEVHPDFRMIVLANRPGFPFLGNDFFGALGDLFSCHSVDNPSPESEIALLKQYGPNVPENIILKLVNAFSDLRNMADKGLVQYPYSTREAVNIVKHLQTFPEESLANVVRNVFDFDQYSSNTLEALIPVLQKHGIPINTDIKNVSFAKDYPLPKISKYGMWDIRKMSSDNQPTVEVKNIKSSGIRNLSFFKTELDMTEVRGTLFSEMHSFATLPMQPGSIAAGIVVSTDEHSKKNFVNVLTLNPFHLHVISLANREVKILHMNQYVPRIPFEKKHKFTLTQLADNFSDYLLIHESNTNTLLLVNIIENTASHLDLTSFSEKIMNSFERNSSGKWEINDALSKKNILIIYGLRRGTIEVLDLDKMNSYSMEFPLKIKSVQVMSDEKWLLQNVDNAKYVLEKKNPEDPFPTVLKHVAESIRAENNIGTINGCTNNDLSDEVLSKILGEKISSPNRLFWTDNCFGAVSVGFPELDCSSSEVYYWPRSKVGEWDGAQGKSVFLDKASQIVTPVAKVVAPDELSRPAIPCLGYLEVVDLKRSTIQYLPVPESSEPVWYIDYNNLGIHLSKMPDESLVTVDINGVIRCWETGYLELQRSLDDWQKMLKQDNEPLRLTIQRDSGKSVSEPKHGKVDPKNEPHVGGNTWAGGTGGRDTAGLGGKGGPYRLDAGHDVHQISDLEKEQVPEEVKKAAREMGLKAFQKRLKEIKMSEYDHEMYQSYLLPVAQQVQMLKVVIENVQAKTKERQWVRHQTSGNLDDLKIIEGLTGEKTIYRRRAEKEPEIGAVQTKPKRLKLVADVSGSMYRFNSYDRRLQRMLEASVLMMEAFENHEDKFKYDITGHSGEGFDINFVDSNCPPKNNKERLEVIKTMHAHSQFCMSGDHTLPATLHAIQTIAKEDCDEAIVIVLSDANLERYGIRPASFGRALTSNPEVNAYAILIGSLGDQAERLAATLPAGRGFVCMDLSNIPRIMQQIFTSSVLTST